MLSVSPLAWSDHAGQLAVTLGPTAKQDTANTLPIVPTKVAVSRLAQREHRLHGASHWPLLHRGQRRQQSRHAHRGLFRRQPAPRWRPAIPRREFRQQRSIGAGPGILRGFDRRRRVPIRRPWTRIGPNHLGRRRRASSQPSTITYSGVNSVQDNLHSNQLSFQSQAPSQNLTITDDGDGQSTLSIANGAWVHLSPYHSV